MLGSDKPESSKSFHSRIIESKIRGIKSPKKPLSHFVISTLIVLTVIAVFSYNHIDYNYLWTLVPFYQAYVIFQSKNKRVIELRQKALWNFVIGALILLIASIALHYKNGLFSVVLVLISFGFLFMFCMQLTLITRNMRRSPPDNSWLCKLIYHFVLSLQNRQKFTILE